MSRVSDFLSGTMVLSGLATIALIVAAVKIDTEDQTVNAIFGFAFLLSLGVFGVAFVLRMLNWAWRALTTPISIPKGTAKNVVIGTAMYQMGKNKGK